MGSIASARAILLPAVPQNGTFTVPYPAGTSQSVMDGADLGELALASGESFPQGEDIGQVEFAFGASAITVTNRTGIPLVGTVILSFGRTDIKGSYHLTKPRRVQEAIDGVVIPEPVATAPAAFGTGQWNVSTGLEPFQIVVNVTELPDDGGSEITSLQYEAGAGWTNLVGAGTGPRILTMPAAGTSYSVRIRARNAIGTGLVSTAKSVTSGAEAAALSRLAVHVDADIDTVGERDDIAAMALWLGNQDDFNLLGFTCSPPDGNHQEYINCINAYETDRPTIIAKPGINSEDFKTGAELLALVQDGANADAPARGYRLVGESQYTNAHAAAQLLIANARDHGDPASADPTRKLWVAVQGGYVTLAQALYEACDPAGPMELPDILDRIRVVGQPNWNSSRAPNSWNYIFGNAWPAAGTPGMFGDLWMICGYLQWHAFNRDNGTTDTTFWNDVTARSAFGQHLRDTLTRPNGTFLTPHFRAGDAGIWFWLKSAKDLGSFDPTNAANLCGVYRTYEGVNPWPSQTVGYGAGSGIQTSNPNPEGVTWSPTIWAPELTVSNYEAAYAAVDLAAWYTTVEGYMARFQTPEVATVPGQVAQPSVTGTGTSRTVSWTAPTDGGSEITDYVITLDGAVVADGVGTSTAYLLTDLAEGSRSVTVAAVNAVGTGEASPPAAFTVTIGGGVEPTNHAWALNEGTGTTVTSADGRTAGLSAALTWGAEPARVIFPGSTGNNISTLIDSAEDHTHYMMGLVVRLDSVSGTRALITRMGSAANDRYFQFRSVSGALNLISFNEAQASSGYSAAAGSVVAGEWALFTAVFDRGATETQAIARKNGAVVASGPVPNQKLPTFAATVDVGMRQGGSDPLDGDIAAWNIKYGTRSSSIEAFEAELRAIATSRGIALP